jgi:hypothetical protein
MIAIKGNLIRIGSVKARWLLSLLLALVFAAPGALLAQFKPEEIAQRGEMETFLRTADIVRSEPAGEGVTHPFKLTLRKGEREFTAFWKNPSGMMNGYWEGWQYEIAAYRLDKLIGLDMIPVTVEREFEGKKGALSLYAEHKCSLLQLVEEKIPVPPEAGDRIEKMKWLTRAWDSLVGNDDRTQQNILYTDDWRTILFDHSRAFRSSDEYTRRLMYGADGIKKASDGHAFLFRRLPRRFYEKIEILTFDSIRSALGDTLNDQEIRSVLARRDLLVKEIDAQIRKTGEADVLYD